MKFCICYLFIFTTKKLGRITVCVLSRQDYNNNKRLTVCVCVFMSCWSQSEIWATLNQHNKINKDPKEVPINAAPYCLYTHTSLKSKENFVFIRADSIIIFLYFSYLFLIIQYSYIIVSLCTYIRSTIVSLCVNWRSDIDDVKSPITYRLYRVWVVPSGTRLCGVFDIDRVRPAWNESNRNGPDRHRNRQTGNGLRSILCV